MSFETDRAAWDWIVDRAGELGLDAELKRDSRGNIIGVWGMAVGSPADLDATHGELLRELGGSEMTLRIAGRPFSLQKESEPRVGLSVQALCSGDLCTSDESFKSSFIVYRELGSRTQVTAGGYQQERRTIHGRAYEECVDYPGPLPVTCTSYCDFAEGCPSGFTQESSRGYPDCDKVCRGDVSRVTVTVSAQAYQYEGSVLAPSFGQTKTTDARSLEVKFWEVAVPGTDTAISEAAGVCGTHTTTGPAGQSVLAKSHAGTVPSTCL